MSAINFAASDADAETIRKIVNRASKLYKEAHGEALDKVSLAMDVTACHLNGCPLNLQALVDADDFNFAHDVFGINRHMNRGTGQLEGCFLPRFSA